MTIIINHLTTQFSRPITIQKINKFMCRTATALRTFTHSKYTTLWEGGHQEGKKSTYCYQAFNDQSTNKLPNPTACLPACHQHCWFLNHQPGKTNQDTHSTSPSLCPPNFIQPSQVENNCVWT